MTYLPIEQSCGGIIIALIAFAFFLTLLLFILFGRSTPDINR